MSGTSNQAHGAGVEDTLKDFWATRPRRPRYGRKVAGVAAGIANRYGLDPVIIRVAFAVATFYGGAGVVFYLLGWLFFAAEDDEVSPAEGLVGRGRSSSSTPFALLLCLGVLGSFSFLFDHAFNGWLGLAIVGGLVFLLHRGRRDQGVVPTGPAPVEAGPVPMWVPVQHGPPVPPPYQPYPTPQGAPVTMPTSTTETPAGAPADATAEVPKPAVDEDGFRTEPPAWDPLGAAPFAWDLPEPGRSLVPDYEPEPPEPRRRSKVGPIAVAVSLLTIGGAVLAESHGAAWLSVPHVIGIVLGILGLGMVAGSFVRGGRGLIGLAVPLAAVGVAMTTFWPNGAHGGVGELTAHPTTLDQVKPDYSLSVGNIALDLSDLPGTGSIRTSASVGAGEITVTVPANADVEVSCESKVGEITCLHDNLDGVNKSTTLTDNGPDGPGGLKIFLQVEAGAGSLAVNRG
ncbi:PspC domain-containing protein [Actinokineospora auranticolor]|uniref:Phage shock protein PspC (Stress-responsive transcriptional regulator) n=1 Tax=Actinokineospora auranticolor TaxID=155976 RepID=A0A2S6GWQ1_9PSEU|nr:PspC domain-containing protein [Actinokineospora auranticolor]PPK69627.1 phage shock protein PspC (stress-responsive transcriptional regulator) [Actinokineospora auranticolor]